MSFESQLKKYEYAKGFFLVHLIMAAIAIVYWLLLYQIASTNHVNKVTLSTILLATSKQVSCVSARRRRRQRRRRLSEPRAVRRRLSRPECWQVALSSAPSGCGEQERSGRLAGGAGLPCPGPYIRSLVKPPTILPHIL